MSKYHDFIIINKSDVIEPFIYVNKEKYINDNSKWFLHFLTNKQKSLYINFKDLQFNIFNYTFTQINSQFKLDMKRSQFHINSYYLKDESIITDKLQNHFKHNQKLYQTILFLSSQTSLAFILIKIHTSLMEEELNKDNNTKVRYYIAELSDKHCKKKMKVNVLLKSEAVVIDKCLRIVKYDDLEQNILTIQRFKITFYFTIQNEKINCLVCFKKI